MVLPSTWVRLSMGSLLRPPHGVIAYASMRNWNAALPSRCLLPDGILREWRGRSSGLSVAGVAATLQSLGSRRSLTLPLAHPFFVGAVAGVPRFVPSSQIKSADVVRCICHAMTHHDGDASCHPTQNLPSWPRAGHPLWGHRGAVTNWLCLRPKLPGARWR